MFIDRYRLGYIILLLKYEYTNFPPYFYREENSLYEYKFYKLINNKFYFNKVSSLYSNFKSPFVSLIKRILQRLKYYILEDLKRHLI